MTIYHTRRGDGWLRLACSALAVAVSIALPAVALAQCAGDVCRVPPQTRPYVPQQLGTQPPGTATSLDPLTSAATPEATGPLAGLFEAFRGLFGQPTSLVSGLFTRSALLAGSLIPAIAQSVTQGLFLQRAQKVPDIRVVDPADPRGQNLIRYEPSPFSRRGQPELKPGDFRVEDLEQRDLVEENAPGSAVIGSQRVGPPPAPLPGTTPPGGTAPAPPGGGAVAPPSSPGGCPGGVCRGR